MARLSLIGRGAFLAFLMAACGTEPGTGQQGGSGGSSPGGGTGGTQVGTGGSAAGTNGGTAGTDPAGGTAGVSVSGGTSGVGPTGGTGGTDPAGGVGGSGPTGGVGGADPTGGAAGTGAGAAGMAGAAGGGMRNEPDLVISGPDSYWQTATWTEATGTADATIAEGTTYQTWTGFGGTFNEAGWDALSVLDAAERDRAIRLLFHADEARFVYGRIPIGASDYGLSRYTLAETANDFTMTSFSIARDRMALIPFIKAALAVNPNIYMWGSPWTPPPWMKSNNAYDRGTMKDDNQVLGAHALYLAKFVEEYAKEGITIKAVHPQNEPGYQQDYPSCGWSSALMTKYIRDYMGPTFMERNVTAEIWMGTLSNPSVDPGIGQAVMADANAARFIKGFGMQWGTRSSAASFVSNYRLPVWQTEHQAGNYPWEGNYNAQRAPNDHAYAQEGWNLFRDWIRANVNAYLAWNMVLDTMGRSLDDVRPWNQNALLAVDRTARQLIVTPTYYLFKHFSYFVDPGAQRIGTTGSFGEVLAFKNPDGSIIAVLYNSGSAARTTTVGVGGKVLQFSIPARGFATVNWQ